MKASATSPTYRRWLMPVTLGMILIAYIWVVSFGRMTTWMPDRSYYSRLADAFTSGQLHLREEPSPELLAAADPYDPATFREYKLADALLYDRHYYFYWGPMPALLVAVVKGITRATVISDRIVTFSFAVGLAIFSALLIKSLAAHAFDPRPPAWVVVGGVLAANLGYPVLFVLARPAIYEAAIMGGQFFLMAGLYFAWRALRQAPIGTRQLWLAGAMWGAALLSRVSLAPVVVALGLVCAWRTFQLTRGSTNTRDRWRRWMVGTLLRVGIPIGAAGMLMGFYNHARFGSFTDFGLKYVLIGAGHRLRDLPQSGFTSFDYLLPNLAAYLVRPPKWEALFPFVRFQPGTDASVLFGFIKNPEMYVAAYPIAGVIWMNQFLLLSIIPIAGLIVAGLRGLIRRTSVKDVGAGAGAVRWFTACLLLAGIGGAAPSLMFLGATVRYIADGSPCFGVLAALGAFGLFSYSLKHPAARAFVSLIAAAVIVASIALGFLSAFRAEGNFFLRNNPDVYSGLVDVTAPRWAKAKLIGALNVNGLEEVLGQPYFWVGTEPAMLFVYSPSRGNLRLHLEVRAGQSAPLVMPQHITVRTADERKELTFSQISEHDVILDANKGVMRIWVETTDTPTPVSPSAGDKRTMIAGVRIMEIRDEPDR